MRPIVLRSLHVDAASSQTSGNVFLSLISPADSARRRALMSGPRPARDKPHCTLPRDVRCARAVFVRLNRGIKIEDHHARPMPASHIAPGTTADSADGASSPDETPTPLRVPLSRPRVGTVEEG